MKLFSFPVQGVRPLDSARAIELFKMHDSSVLVADELHAQLNPKSVFVNFEGRFLISDAEETYQILLLEVNSFGHFAIFKYAVQFAEGPLQIRYGIPDIECTISRWDLVPQPYRINYSV